MQHIVRCTVSYHSFRSGISRLPTLRFRHITTYRHSVESRTILRYYHRYHREMAPAVQDGTPTEGKEAEAPWRALFLEHVQGMTSPEFTLATVRRMRTSAGAERVIPRARTCIFRSLFAELPVDPRNPADRNPDGVWASDLPTFTTDARMDKLPELFGEEIIEEAEGDGGVLMGTGGGGSVEATFVSTYLSTAYLPPVQHRWFVIMNH